MLGGNTGEIELNSILHKSGYMNVMKALGKRRDVVEFIHKNIFDR